MVEQILHEKSDYSVLNRSIPPFIPHLGHTTRVSKHPQSHYRWFNHKCLRSDYCLRVNISIGLEETTQKWNKKWLCVKVVIPVES